MGRQWNRMRWEFSSCLHKHLYFKSIICQSQYPFSISIQEERVACLFNSFESFRIHCVWKLYVLWTFFGILFFYSFTLITIATAFKILCGISIESFWGLNIWKNFSCLGQPIFESLVCLLLFYVQTNIYVKFWI